MKWKQNTSVTPNWKLFQKECLKIFNVYNIILSMTHSPWDNKETLGVCLLGAEGIDRAHWLLNLFDSICIHINVLPMVTTYILFLFPLIFYMRVVNIFWRWYLRPKISHIQKKDFESNDVNNVDILETVAE